MDFSIQIGVRFDPATSRFYSFVTYPDHPDMCGPDRRTKEEADADCEASLQTVKTVLANFKEATITRITYHGEQGAREA